MNLIFQSRIQQGRVRLTLLSIACAKYNEGKNGNQYLIQPLHLIIEKNDEMMYDMRKRLNQKKVYHDALTKGATKIILCFVFKDAKKLIRRVKSGIVETI